MIQFDCPCGKRLNASDRLAGTTATCPSCRMQIDVPERKATAQARLSTSVRVPGQSIFVKVPRSPIERNSAQSVIRRRTGNYHEPTESLRFVAPLSAGLAVLTAIGGAAYPELLHDGLSSPIAWVPTLTWIVLTGLALGYGCNYLDAVLSYALAGKGFIYLPDRTLGPAVRSLARWGLCFLCGPALLFLAALGYWVHCGDVDWIDGLILTELTAGGFGFWVFSLVLTAPMGEASDSPSRHPSAILGRFDRRRLLAGLSLLVVALVHLGLVIFGLLVLRDAWPVGLVLLWFVWFSAAYSATITLKHVGWRLDRAPKIPRPGPRREVAV